MVRCAFCDATIIFGGRRVGDLQYCNTHHALMGRGLTVAPSDTSIAELQNVIRFLHEDVMALAAEVQEQRVGLAESQERVDFLERALAQVRSQQSGGQ